MHEKDRFIIFSKDFVIGLLTITPLLILFILVGVLYDYFKDLFQGIIGKTNSIPFTIFLFLITISSVVWIGRSVRKYDKSYVIHVVEEKVFKIPLLGAIAKTIKDMINIFNSDNKEKFLGTCEVIFAGGIAQGLITNKFEKEGEQFYKVFVLTAPNPTSGYVLVYRFDEVNLTPDVSIDDVFKNQLSLGVAS